MVDIIPSDKKAIGYFLPASLEFIGLQIPINPSIHPSTRGLRIFLGLKIKPEADGASFPFIVFLNSKDVFLKKKSLRAN